MGGKEGVCSLYKRHVGLIGYLTLSEEEGVEDVAARGGCKFDVVWTRKVEGVVAK